MTSDLLWIYTFNVVFNSALSFATSSIIALLLLKVLSVRDGRLRMLLLTIPFAKLSVDLLLYDFSNWALLHHFNPLLAEEGSRTIGIMFFFPGATLYPFLLSAKLQMMMQSGHTFTPADLLALSSEPLWIKACVVVILSGTVVLSCLRLCRFYRSYRRLSLLRRSATPCFRPITHAQLKHRIDNAGIDVATSESIDVPCAIGVIHKMILLPQQLLDQLTQDEFEAILAHEAAHLRWYDGLVRLYVDAISTLFWWIPAQWLRRRLVLSQEYACDDSSRQIDIPAVDMASAIVKSARSANGTSSCLPVACFINQSPVSWRLRRLLTDSPALPGVGWRWTSRLALACVALIVLFSKYWIF